MIHKTPVRQITLPLEGMANIQKNNLYPFNFRALPVYNIISKKPITKMEDFRGLKIRTFGTVAPKIFKAVGAIPVNIQFHEVYEGLQRGTVDAAFTSTAAGFAYKLQEVAEYIIDLPLGADPCYQSFVNLDVYNSWPQNLKDLFNQIVLSSPLPGAFELSESGLIILLFFGLAVTSRSGSHIKVDILTNRLSVRGQKICNAIGYLFTSVLFALWTQQMYFMALKSFKIRETANGLLQFPVYIVKMVAVLGINEIWYAVIIVKLMEIAVVSPPVGLSFFAVLAATDQKISIGDLYK